MWRTSLDCFELASVSNVVNGAESQYTGFIQIVNATQCTFSTTKACHITEFEGDVTIDFILVNGRRLDFFNSKLKSWESDVSSKYHWLTVPDRARDNNRILNEKHEEFNFVISTSSANVKFEVDLTVSLDDNFNDTAHETQLLTDEMCFLLFTGETMVLVDPFKKSCMYNYDPVF